MALLNTEQVAVQYTAPPPLIRAQDAWHRCSLVLAAVLMLAVFTILTFAVLQPSSPANVFLAQKPLSRSSRPRSRQLIINANDGTQATAAAPGPAVAPQALPVVNDHVGNALVVAGVLGLVIVYILRKRSRGALHHEYALAGEGWFPEKLQPGAAPEQTEQRKKPQEVLPKAARSCSEGQIASRVPVAAPALALNVQSFAGPPRGALTAQSFAFNPLNRSFNSTLWRPNLSDPEEYVMDEASMNKMPTITTEDTHEDVWRALSVVSAFSLLLGVLYRTAIMQYPALPLCCIFIIGYAGIVFEEIIHLNKNCLALLMAVCLWTLRTGAVGPTIVHKELHGALSEAAEILFFLLGAMTIVEIVDAHHGFRVITENIHTNNRRTLLFIVGVVTFCLSAVLDNLTSTIVMVSLLRKMLPDHTELRMLLGGLAVIAANAGGAWTPIGDVTTTMLWISGNITTWPTMLALILPSIVALLVPLLMMSRLWEFAGTLPPMPASRAFGRGAAQSRLFFVSGIIALMFVPVFKMCTGLPPYLGMLASLGTMWLMTDVIHFGETDAASLKAPAALSRIDSQGILFFLGILMSVSCLNAAGILGQLSSWLITNLPFKSMLAAAIGLASAVIDNVPIVAATMGMYSQDTMPINDTFWHLVAYCAGTGGSIMIVGSASGLAFMGIEGVEFGWYAKRIGGFAASGYFAGMAVYMVVQPVLAMWGVVP